MIDPAMEGRMQMGDDSTRKMPIEAVGAGHSRLARSPQRQWPWLIGGLVLALVKGQALVGQLHHRTALIVFLSLVVARSVLRRSPVALAVLGGALFAFALAPHPIMLGIAVGVGAVVVLLTLFVAIGRVLHARQHRHAPRWRPG
jgi:hypothetical protein